MDEGQSQVTVTWDAKFNLTSGVLWRVFLSTIFLYSLGTLHARQTTLQTSDSTRFLGHHQFDSFEIYFGHTKTNQTGDDAKYPCHIKANPLHPFVCPVFALLLDFTCCDNVIQMEDDMLFPGPDQY